MVVRLFWNPEGRRLRAFTRLALALLLLLLLVVYVQVSEIVAVAKSVVLAPFR